MQIDIQTRHLTLTESLRQHVQRRLENALGRYRLWVERIEVRLAAACARRGEADPSCLIVVRLQRLPALIIKDLATDLYAAIDHAVEKARWTVAQRISHRLRVKRLLGTSAAGT